MKIIRDGKEFELTEQELRQAYDEKDMEYTKEDIRIAASQAEIGIEEGDLDAITDKFERYLDRCDGYWEHYWGVMMDAIEDYVKEHTNEK